jgi:putative transcriptional regulator
VAAESLRGRLLVAIPPLRDPNFWRTVVLVVEHSPDGALGLVLNRPADTTVGEAVPQLHPLIDEDEPVFLGGPVAPTGVIVLARFEDPSDSALLAFDDVGLIGVAGGEDPLEVGVRDARAFIGHAGWGPGQLDAELERGDWILEPATHADAFAARPAELWGAVLRRKGGHYALLARMPEDLSVN